MVVVGLLQSVTVGGAIVTDATHPDVFGARIRLAGQVITGLPPSLTITCCEQVLVLPFTSVTVQVTVVGPSV